MITDFNFPKIRFVKANESDITQCIAYNTLTQGNNIILCNCHFNRFAFTDWSTLNTESTNLSYQLLNCLFPRIRFAASVLYLSTVPIGPLGFLP